MYLLCHFRFLNQFDDRLGESIDWNATEKTNGGRTAAEKLNGSRSLATGPTNTRSR